MAETQPERGRCSGPLWIPGPLGSPETRPLVFFFLHHQSEGHPLFPKCPSPRDAVPRTELGGLAETLAVPRTALV